MTSQGIVRRIILAILICAVVLCLISPAVFATEAHEDPETAEQIFGGIALFRYYSNSLDFVLQKDPAEVEARLQKMPFANIPRTVERPTDDFATSGISISHLVVDVDEDLSKLRTLVEQFRFDEAIELADETSGRLFQANRDLRQIEKAAVLTGSEFAVSDAPAASDLRLSYHELLEKIDEIRSMLGLYQDILTNLLLGTEEIEALRSTEVTLKIEPSVAFVGDDIRFDGALTTEGKPLARREIDILVNGSQYITARTDTNGRYQGTLQVPYQYMPEMNFQALYYPKREDAGLYISSLSPVIKLKVLFYEAELEITVEDKAYPGLETAVRGRFDYSQAPPLTERRVEVYFDDVFIAEVEAGGAFTQRMQIDPEVTVGKHIITVSAVAAGRYSSVVTSAILNVTRATPILDINIPRVAIIPGSIGLSGRLYSEVGPLSEASIKMELGGSHIELVSSRDGTFDTKIGMGVGFSLIGSQELVVQVLPQEPWHAPLVTTKSTVIVNVINCSGTLIILVLLGMYLPRRLQRRLGTYPRRRVRPTVPVAVPEPTPTYHDTIIVPALTEDSGEPHNRIFYWYRLVARLIQGLTKGLLGPQQTLREFARESSRVLGPAAKYFVELTTMVERLLYSKYRPTEGDLQKSKQLSHNIEERLKSENI